MEEALKACREGDVESLKKILVVPCEEETLKARDVANMYTEACRRGHTNIVKYLLDSNMNPGCTNGFGYNAMHVACQNNQPEIVKLLIDSCEENSSLINSTGLIDDWTPLAIGSAFASAEVVRLLIDSVDSVNTKFSRGYTALHAACMEHKLDSMELLVDHGAELEAKTDDGLTPLMIICSQHDRSGAKAVSLLLDLGADIETRDNRGRTPLIAARHKRKTKVAGLLIDRGARIDAVNTDGPTDH